MSILQGFNDAVNIIVDSALDKRKYDITIICEIVSVSNDEENCYIVQSDSMKFKAYSNNSDTSYKVGNNVNVLIPRGDYSQRKLIMSRADDESDVAEHSEVLQFNDVAAAWSVEAINVGEKIFGPARRIHMFPDKQLHIQLSTDVQSSIEEFKIKCLIQGLKIDGSSISVSCTWYSSEMFGNVAHFTIPFKQEIVLTNKEIQKLNKIISMTINVVDINDNTITSEKVNLTNLSFSIGYLKSNLTDGLYFITENDTYTYTVENLIRQDTSLVWIYNKQFQFNNIQMPIKRSEGEYDIYNIENIEWLDTTSDYVLNKTMLSKCGLILHDNVAEMPIIYYYMYRALKVGPKENKDDVTITYDNIDYNIENDLVQIPNTENYLYIPQGGVYLYKDGYVNDNTKPIPRYKTHWMNIGGVNNASMRPGFEDTSIKAIIIDDNKSIIAEANQVFTNNSWNTEMTFTGTPNYLTLSSARTFYPIYDNYGSIINNSRKSASARRSDEQDFSERYITWRFDLAGMLKFPHAPEYNDELGWHWYPSLSSSYTKVYWQKDKGAQLEDITNLLDWENDDEHKLNVGYAYLTLPISEPAQPQTINFFINSRFDLNNATTLMAYAHMENDTVSMLNNFGSITFTFGCGDSHGTGYSFNIICNNEYDSFSSSVLRSEQKEFEAVLYAEDGQVVNLSEAGNKIRWSWLHETVHSEKTNGVATYNLLSIEPKDNNFTELYYRIFLETQKKDGLYTYDSRTGAYTEAPKMESGKEYYTKKITATSNKCNVTGVFSTPEATLYAHNFHILVAELRDWPLSNGQYVTLRAYRPMVISSFNNIKIQQIQGSTNMIYDTFGHKVSMNDEGVQYSIDNIDTSISASVYRLFRNENNLLQVASDANNYDMAITDGVLEQPMLNPTNDGSIFTLLLQSDENNTKWIKIPLVITTNSWFSNRLNEWDGSVTIDNENNYILSAMIGAGKKDNENKFTGVLMGEVGQDLRNAESGIYGFNKGECTFKVSAETGSAYFSGKIESREGEIAGWILKQSGDDHSPFLYSIGQSNNEKDTQYYASGLSNNGDVVFFAGAPVTVDSNNLNKDVNLNDLITDAQFTITKDGSINTSGVGYLNGIKLAKLTDNNRVGVLSGDGQGVAKFQTGSASSKETQNIILQYKDGKRGHSTYECDQHSHTGAGSSYVHTYYNSLNPNSNWYNYVYILDDDWNNIPAGTVTINGYNGSLEIFAINLNSKDISGLWTVEGEVHDCIHTAKGNTIEIPQNDKTYNCIIVNTSKSSDMINASVNYTTTISGESTIKSQSYTNNFKIQSDGIIRFGDWELTGLGFIGYANDGKTPKTLLRPDGFYSYDSSTGSWSKKTGWEL